MTLWARLFGPPRWRPSENQNAGLYYLLSGYIWEYGPEKIRIMTLDKRFHAPFDRGILARAADAAARLVAERVRSKVEAGQLPNASTMHWTELLRAACDPEPLPVFAGLRDKPALLVTLAMLDQGLRGEFEALLLRKVSRDIRKARRRGQH